MSEYTGDQTYKIRHRDVGCYCFRDQYVHWLEAEIKRLRADASYQCAAQWRDKYHAAEAGCKRLRDLLSKAHACVCLLDCPDDCGGDDVRHGELCVRIREELEK